MIETISMVMPERGEVFTHKDEDGTLRTFATCLMVEFAEKYAAICPYIKKCTATIHASTVKHLREQFGIEQDRLDRLCEPYLSRPGIGILWHGIHPERGDHFTSIDGNHRTVKLFEAGIRRMEVYLFKPIMWKQFLLDAPPEYQRRALVERSGVIEAERERNAG